MNTLLISTFIGIPMFIMGFWLARMFYLPQIHSAELRGLSNRRVLELKRTDAENAAGMVS